MDDRCAVCPRRPSIIAATYSGQTVVGCHRSRAAIMEVTLGVESLAAVHLGPAKAHKRLYREPGNGFGSANLCGPLGWLHKVGPSRLGAGPYQYRIRSHSSPQ